jgi:hypothetical protein
VESKLGPLGTSATNWPTAPATGDCEDGEFGGMKILENLSVSECMLYMIFDSFFLTVNHSVEILCANFLLSHIHYCMRRGTKNAYGNSVYSGNTYTFPVLSYSNVVSFVVFSRVFLNCDTLCFRFLFFLSPLASFSYPPTSRNPSLSPYVPSHLLLQLSMQSSDSYLFTSALNIA